MPAILDAQFKFHEGYQIPQGAEVDAFRKAIETLPLIDNTNLFGLHPNADIAFRTRQTSMVGYISPISPLHLPYISPRGSSAVAHCWKPLLSVRLPE